MARLDVYANPEASERKLTPYFMDLQNNHIDHLATRVVVPLRREAAFGPRARNLNPLFAVGSDNVVMDTAALGAVPGSELRKPVAQLGAHFRSVTFAGEAQPWYIDGDEFSASPSPQDAANTARYVAIIEAAKAGRVNFGELPDPSLDARRCSP